MNDLTIKKVLAILILCVFSNCKDFEKEPKGSEINNQISTKVETKPIEIKEVVAKPVYIQEQFKNFIYELPSNLKLEKTLSNANKRVYTSDEDFGMTIDADYIPSGYENSTISTLISNPNQFANAVNQNQMQNFSDFKLIGYNYESLGNAKSFIINQTSKDISGYKNTYMDVKSHFLVSSPYYCSISFSFPQNSANHKATLLKIEKSFIFPESKISDSSLEKSTVIEEQEKPKKERPSLYDTKKWILEKFKSYGNPDYTYNLVGYDLIIKTSTNPDRAIEYTIPLCNSSIYENRSHTFSTERITFSMKSGRIKIDRNWKGFPHFESSFDFDLRYSSEDDLVNRINDALENLKYNCPNNTSKKQTF